jgi:hypothetical protein
MKIDKDLSGTVETKEFRQGLPLMKKFGLNIHDPDAEFLVLQAQVGEGKEVSFNDFAHFCIKKSMLLSNKGGGEGSIFRPRKITGKVGKDGKFKKKTKMS